MFQRSVLVLFAFLFVTLLAPHSSHAHGGGHSQNEALDGLIKADEPPAAIEPRDSMYAVEDGTKQEKSLPGSSLPDLGLQPMDMGGMQHEPGHVENAGEHVGHKMQEVEISSHEWVSASRKGYGAALGITLLAGLGFVALTVIKPCE